jgi:hypothetical protein
VAPSSASRASVGASQPAEAAPATATAIAGPKGGVVAAGLSRSVQAQKPKMRASRSGGSSCSRARARGRSASARRAVSPSQRGAQGRAQHALFAPSAAQRRIRAPMLRRRSLLGGSAARRAQRARCARARRVGR